MTERSNRRAGFTLIELLVVVAVIGFLASMVFTALRGAQQDAFAAKTRSTIRKIETVLSERIEEYRNMKVDFAVFAPSDPNDLRHSPSQLPTTGPMFSRETAFTADSDAMMHARIRLNLLRDLIRSEMPDCPGAIIERRANKFYPRDYQVFFTGYFDSTGRVTCQISSAPKRDELVSRLYNVAGQSDGSLNPVVFEEFFNAELLFLVVETSYTAGGYGIEAFGASEYADVDGDGLREFVDAWGVPIQWVLWPAGYNDDPLTSQTTSLRGSNASGFAFLNRFDPDPFYSLAAAGKQRMGGVSMDDFDSVRADLGYVVNRVNNADEVANLPVAPLRPLIVSAGLDGETGLRFLWSGNNSQDSDFVSTTLFTASDVYWPVAGFEYRWVDPYHPRPPTKNVAYSETLNQSLGGVLSVAVDGGGSGPFDIPIGVKPDGTFVYGASLSGSAEEINEQLRSLSEDNLTNFDELGGGI